MEGNALKPWSFSLTFDMIISGNDGYEKKLKLLICTVLRGQVLMMLACGDTT